MGVLVSGACEGCECWRVAEWYCRGIPGIRLGLPSDQQFGDFLSVAACDKKVCDSDPGRTAAQDAVPCVWFSA